MIVLSLCSWTNIVGIKAFAVTTIGIRAWVEDFGKSKRSSKLPLAQQKEPDLTPIVGRPETHNKAPRMPSKTRF